MKKLSKSVHQILITDLNPTKQNVVKNRIFKYWSNGYSAKEIASRIKIKPNYLDSKVKESEDLSLSIKSVAALMGHWNRLYVD